MTLRLQFFALFLIQDGVSGLKCSNCSDGFHSLSSQGCIPCSCSNRTSQCSAEMDPTSGQSQEICDCPFPFTGSSCEKCFLGYYLSATSGRCEQCNCNNRAETCSDGDGECIVSVHQAMKSLIRIAHCIELHR